MLGVLYLLLMGGLLIHDTVGWLITGHLSDLFRDTILSIESPVWIGRWGIVAGCGVIYCIIPKKHQGLG